MRRLLSLVSENLVGGSVEVGSDPVLKFRTNREFAIAHLEVCSSWIELRPQFQAFRVSVPYGIRLQSGRGVLEGHESRLVAPPQSAGSERLLYFSKPLNIGYLW